MFCFRSLDYILPATKVSPFLNRKRPKSLTFTTDMLVIIPDSLSILLTNVMRRILRESGMSINMLGTEVAIGNTDFVLSFPLLTSPTFLLDGQNV